MSGRWISTTIGLSGLRQRLTGTRASKRPSRSKRRSRRRGTSPTFRLQFCETTPPFYRCFGWQLRPPIARDRLVGLSGASPNLVRSMELARRIPRRMSGAALADDLSKMGAVILKLADKDILVWLEERRGPSRGELHRAATIIADRLCGAVSKYQDGWETTTDAARLSAGRCAGSGDPRTTLAGVWGHSDSEVRLGIADFCRRNWTGVLTDGKITAVV